MNKVCTVQEAVSKVKSGYSLMTGGFLQAGSPETLIKGLLEYSDADNLHIISNDTGNMQLNTVKLMQAGRVTKIDASYIGANPLTGQMLINDPTSVTLHPQGTLAEKIRAAGAGIKGFYTKVGVGTIIEEGKEKVNIDGEDCILELPLKGDVAFIHAKTVDEFGNCFLRGSSKNFNVVMATAADYVVVEAEEIVPVGKLDPELVTISGVYVDAIVKGEKANG